ncbi:hypothetical protein PAPHI01_0965 [Pancytospora philotis]|nr:hypothetical protein PAPHI01_0965 [Pancytospora philotis]
MIFGKNPTYIYGELYRDKFSTPLRAYPVDAPPVSCTACPAKVVDGKAQLFFAGPIFNTYVESVEDRVSVLRSYDGKLTIIKSRQPMHQLLTVKILREDAKAREVELYKFNDVFPGLRTTGTLELLGGRHLVHTERRLKGPIVLQNNTQAPVTSCLLFQIENGEHSFVEIDNPVERCTVTVEKDQKPVKIVSSGNVRGILVESKSTQTDIAVYARRVCLGSYVFVEDIAEGPATVTLLHKEDGKYKVGYRGFVGECVSSGVSRTMRGVIYDIRGSSFKFRKDDDAAAGQSEAAAAPTADDKPKKMKANSDSDALRQAVEETQAKIAAGGNAIPLFKKHIMCLEEKDEMCRLYVKYLDEKKLLTTSELAWVLRQTGPDFCKAAVKETSDPAALEFLLTKRGSKTCYAKLLALSSNKPKFIKAHPRYLDAAVEYAYKHEPEPYKFVEAFVGRSIGAWAAWLRCESGDTKRGLFERAVANDFTKEEMKALFKMWLEFEESAGGDVEAVKKLAREYVASKKNE